LTWTANAREQAVVAEITDFELLPQTLVPRQHSARTRTQKLFRAMKNRAVRQATSPNAAGIIPAPIDKRRQSDRSCISDVTVPHDPSRSCPIAGRNTTIQSHAVIARDR
jgi:hypothetical protein